MTDKELVEQKFGKHLKDVMYDVCVIQQMDKWEGADYLGVPANTFVKWRTQYRFGPMQLKHDYAVEYSESIKQQYKEELADVDLLRDMKNTEEANLTSFREIIFRMLEIEKYKRVNNDFTSFDNLGSTIQIGLLQSTIEHIDKYQSGKLYEEYLMKKADLEKEKK